MGKRIAAVLACPALLLAAAGGGYYAYTALKDAPTVVSGTEEGMVVTRKSKVSVPGGVGDVVVEETVSSKTEEEDLAISDEEAAKVELPFAVGYFADRLTEDEATVCRQLYKGMTEREDIIYIKKNVISSDDICQLIVMCVTGAPEIDYIESSYSVQVDANGCASAVYMSYTRNEEDQQVRRKLTEQAVDRICMEVTSDWTDFRKYKLVHDAIVNGCTYYESGDDCYTAYGCLVGGNAVCEGYSKALMMLCDKVGIPCLPVIGQGLNDDGSSQGHIWNKVMLDGEWYAADITWDDPLFESADNYLRYDYFSVTDEEMGRNHIPDGNKYINEPECTATELDYYRYCGYYAETSDDAGAAFGNAVEDAMNNGEIYARIKCGDRKCFDETLDWVFGDGTGNSDLFDMIRSGIAENPDAGYEDTGYSVINNAVTYNISIRLKNG